MFVVLTMWFPLGRLSPPQVDLGGRRTSEARRTSEGGPAELGSPADLGGKPGGAFPNENWDLESISRPGEGFPSENWELESASRAGLGNGVGFGEGFA